MRRFTRLTNGFSKKLENHIAAVSLYFMYYNFVRIHQTLRITPAMAAGITDRVWEISDIVNLLDEQPDKPNYQDEAHYGPALGINPTGYGTKSTRIKEVRIAGIFPLGLFNEWQSRYVWIFIQLKKRAILGIRVPFAIGNNGT